MVKFFTLSNTIAVLLVGVSVWALVAQGPIWQVSIVVLWALFLFATERFPVDVTALLIMATLMLTGLVTPQEGVSGFSNIATLTVLFMFIISAAVEKTGVVQQLAGKVFSYVKKSNLLQIGVLSAVIGPVSGFINNTATVAIFLPSILNFSRKYRTAPTKLLIPLSFISMLGGMLTVFGTSTNILANDILIKSGFVGFGVFEFFGLGMVGLLVGALYFMLIGRFILPTRFGEGTKNPEDADKFLAELRLNEGSELVGKNLHEVKFGEQYHAEVLRIIRDGEVIVNSIADTQLRVGDVLLLLTHEEDLIELDLRENEQLVPNFRAWDRERIEEGKFVKVLFKSNALRGRTSTLRDLNFYRKYGLAVMGVHRNREDITNDAQHIGDIELHSGEVFLAKVPLSQLERVRRIKNLMILEEFGTEYDQSQLWRTLGILVMVVGLAALDILPLMVAALLGVLLLFMLECISADEIYNSVHWNVIFLLAGVIPLGIALEKSGAINLFAHSVTFFAGAVPTIVLLGILYLVTTLTTQVISNNATVVLMMPIALSVAVSVGLEPKAAALAIMFAASTAFLSPVGYQTNAMVYSAGNYKFVDFIKVGAPLNLLLLVVMTGLIYYTV